MSNSEPTFYPFRISIVKYNGSRQIFGGARMTGGQIESINSIIGNAQ